MPLPPETVDHIIDFVGTPRALQACSLVAKSWVSRSRTHLFRDVVLFSHRRWQKIMPVGDASPAVYTRTLTLAQGITSQGRWINTDNLYPFLPHLRDFKNVETLILDGWISSRFTEGGLKKYFGIFGPSLRSLELGGNKISPDSLLVLLGHLPNLENLSMKERIKEEEEITRAPATPPKLSGRLTTHVPIENLPKVLCTIPLRFREICLLEHRHDYQELVTACAETLVDFRAMSVDWGK